ncbi:T9SS type A sorting domain-containing protein [Flavobacterium sp.]|jgi:hypothetical protein|uniref:T9SS type A sorting domain-containing protein n=1 Tax=Flavobacterium sp. TaxID=239 RepID=UPI0037BE7C03
MRCFFIFLFLITISNFFAQTINIPDSNFKNVLITADNDGINNIAKNLEGQYFKIDSNDDNEIQLIEALQVSSLSMNNKNIINLEGLQYFINLSELYCGSNPLTNLPFSTLTQITILFIPNCGLSAIDLSNLTSLNFLYCHENQINTLDLSGNHFLDKLICKNNNLTLINIKNGINQDFNSTFNNDCWKTGNPNLTTICADESELVAVQNFLDNCGSAQAITINSNCNLSNQDFTINQIAIYPNPVNDVLNINLENSIISSVTIFNTLGQKVYFSYSTTSQIDVSKLEAGAYFLKVDGLEGEYYGRFVKK